MTEQAQAARGASAVRIHPTDTVCVAVRALAAGETALGVTALEAIPAGHKMALAPIAAGAAVVKYGVPIGRASQDIEAGAWVHTHNLRTGLSGEEEYVYEPAAPVPLAPFAGAFMGYPRADGRAGTRNELWIVPTVGCVNRAAELIAARAGALLRGKVDGVFALTHPFGCSQLGEDHAATRSLLLALCRHPNAGGVLVLGLGCENNAPDAFRERLLAGEGAPNAAPPDPARFRFLTAQDVEDEVAEGVRLALEIGEAMASDRREPLPVSKLVVGLKCGGSDGFSGVTGNPLLGRLCDGVTAAGGTALLTEVPEMFGAERLLMARARDEGVFRDIVEMINGFKRYFLASGQPVYENPSPGNKAGGISTLEDKSLGCTQKGGFARVDGVLPYAKPAAGTGLQLVTAPGNDLTAVTALCAAGANVILFTTGRGTPLGAPVPVMKVATNASLAARKASWVDFDASPILAGTTPDALARTLLEKVLRVAGGEQTKAELAGARDLAIWKTGVTE